MLTFFRRLRKGLLDRNRLSKYLLYAVGEIVLVVLGILIALQINNWNENIAREEKIEGHLYNLLEAIKMDSASLDRLLNAQGFRFHAIKYLIELTGNEITNLNYEYAEFPSDQLKAAWDKPIPLEYNEEFIEVCLGWLPLSPAGVIINRSAIDEFRTTGLFSAMKNIELKKKILDYYRRADGLYTGRGWEYKFDLSLKVQEVFLKQYNIDIQRVENVQAVVDKIKNEQLLLSNLHLLVDNVSWSCQTFLRSQGQIAELLVDLRAELAER